MFGPAGVLPMVLPFTQIYPGFTQLLRVKLGKTVLRFYPSTLIMACRLTYNLYQFKEYGSRRLLSEFLEINWNKRGLNSLLKKIREAESTDKRHGSDRPKHARTAENVTTVDELVLSQDDQPQTHRSTRQISRQTGL